MKNINGIIMNNLVQDNKSVQGVKCYDFFISHSSKDREFFKRIDLEEIGKRLLKDLPN